MDGASGDLLTAEPRPSARDCTQSFLNNYKHLNGQVFRDCAPFSTRPWWSTLGHPLPESLAEGHDKVTRIRDYCAPSYLVQVCWQAEHLLQSGQISRIGNEH
jgi:hypothetical protein